MILDNNQQFNVTIEQAPNKSVYIIFWLYFLIISLITIASPEPFLDTFVLKD